MTSLISLDKGFQIILDDPNNIIASNHNSFVKDMNWVVNTLTTYIDFVAPLTFQINVRPSSDNPNQNNDGGLPATGISWITNNGITTLASIIMGQTGFDPNGSQAELGFTFYLSKDGLLKNYGSQFWFDPSPVIGITPIIPFGQTDFAGVALHETLHCLGFATWASQNAPWNQHIITKNSITYYTSNSILFLLGGDLPIAPDTTDSGYVSDHIGNTNIGYQPIKSDLMYQ
jgi:hypothetical protein